MKLITIKSFSARSVSKEGRIKSARVERYGTRCFWCPNSQNDSSDYIEINLGKKYCVNAVSTRGRPVQRDDKTFEATIGYPREWVSKYKLFYKESVENEWIFLG